MEGEELVAAEVEEPVAVEVEEPVAVEVGVAAVEGEETDLNSIFNNRLS